MSKTKQKRSSAGKSIAVFFIVFVILEGLLIFGLKTIFKNENSAPSIGGYTLFIMDSDNMSPSVPKNTLVIAMNGTPSVDKIKSAVLCRNVGDEGTTVAWLSEIGSKGDTVDGVIYSVYQDNVAGQDSAENTIYYDVGSSDVIGVATSRYDLAGKIISFVLTPFGMVICLAVPLIMMILLELVVAITGRTDDGYEAEDYPEEYPDNDIYEDDETDKASLDDFLYGGNDDEVYNSKGKPASDYAEEFPQDDAPAPVPVKRRGGKPDFVLNIPDEDETPDPFGGEDEEEEVPPFMEEPASEIPTEPEPEFEEEEDEVFEGNEVDRMYYEKAAKLIEGDDYKPKPVKTAKPKAAKPAPAPEPVQPVQLEKPKPAAAAPAPAEQPVQLDKPAARPAARRAPAQQGARRRPPQSSTAARRRPSQGGAPSRQGSSSPQRRPRPTQSRPAQRRAPHKDANAALQDLMKKMEEEQKKLGGE